LEYFFPVSCPSYLFVSGSFQFYFKGVSPFSTRAPLQPSFNLATSEPFFFVLYFSAFFSSLTDLLLFYFALSRTCALQPSSSMPRDVTQFHDKIPNF
jgi:hypothetical protein